MDILQEIAKISEFVLTNFAELGVFAYLALLVIAFLDSLIITGTFTNAVVFLLLAGALGTRPEFEIWLFVLAAFFGALLGSWAGYTLGRYGSHLIASEAIKSDKKRTKLSNELIDRFGPLAIIIGRFLGPVSSIVSFVAGTTKLSPRRFLAASIIASALWATSFIMFGELVISIFTW
jgi:undecaprenyl-diphosphatase